MDEAWEQSSQQKLENGTWRDVPWGREPWYRFSNCGTVGCFCRGGTVMYPWQFVHINRDGDVEFFAAPEHGMRGRITTMRAGRYLTKYFVLLPEQIVATWAAAAAAMSLHVKFAMEADEIEAVYTTPNGPQSCMDHRHSFNSEHPTRMYAGHGLGIAYIGEPGKAIRARALVWPNEKRYSRIYGETELLRSALDALDWEDGYTRGTLFIGARMQRKAFPTQGDNVERHVLPYLDGELGVKTCEDPEVFELCASNDQKCCAVSTPHGYTQAVHRCEMCSTRQRLYARTFWEAEGNTRTTRHFCTTCWPVWITTHPEMACCAAGCQNWCATVDMVEVYGESKDKLVAICGRCAEDSLKTFPNGNVTLRTLVYTCPRCKIAIFSPEQRTCMCLWAILM
jgi:hypothetical protein